MKENEAKQIKETFNFYRGLLLDLFEQELGDTKKWPFIRSRLLKFLSSERGLEAKVMEIVMAGDRHE